MEDLFLGIEIGASKQQIALGDGTGRLLNVICEKISLVRGADDIKDWLLLKVASLLDQEAQFGGKVRGIVVGFGGILQSSSGHILISVQVNGWNDFNLKDWFEQNFKLPTIIINDTAAGGYGELISGSGKNSKNFFYSNIGSGIGGAFFFNRTYYDGIGYGSGYIGHTYIPDWDIPGKHIKLENVCSGFAIEKRLRVAGYVPTESIIYGMCGGEVSSISSKMLEDAAYKGDKFALEEIKRIAWSYSIALSNIITLNSPDVVSIGGGVSNMGDILIDKIRQFTDELVFISGKGRYKIVQTQLGERAVIIGAVLLGKEFIKL